MARAQRTHVPGSLHHVTLRGNAKGRIFFSDSDRTRLNNLFNVGLPRFSCRLHAYCWMTNHIHAIIQVSDRPLSELMRWLASKYARITNRLQGRSGHLFERRYFSRMVIDDQYLLCLVRYIHFNPVEAGLVTEPGLYEWSSHRAYLGERHPNWLTTRAVLSAFADSMAAARTNYQQFVTDYRGDWQPDLVSTADQSLSVDEMAFDRPLVALEEFLSVECERAGWSLEELRGPGRQRDAAYVRAKLCDRALRGGHASLSELATYFRRAPEVISRGIRRYCNRRSLKKSN